MGPPPPPSDPRGAASAGTLVAGRYRLESPLATGGMARVWTAHDEVLDRRVAVKILLDHLATDAAFVTRFRAEALAAARLTHPSVVSVYDTSTAPGPEAIVMELIDGETLRQRLDRERRLDPEELARIGSRIAEALAVAHAEGIVHRDIKPANVLLASTGRVVVTDFGIAKAADNGDLTSGGQMLGTAKYLAPEQVEATPVDGRADVYALGVVLFEAACGQVPFLADTDPAIALARLHRDAPSPLALRPDLPPDLAHVIDRTLVRDRDGRWPDARSLSRTLGAIAVGRTPPPEPGRTPTPAPPPPRPSAAAPDLAKPPAPASPASPPPAEPGTTAWRPDDPSPSPAPSAPPAAPQGTTAWRPDEAPAQATPPPPSPAGTTAWRPGDQPHPASSGDPSPSPAPASPAPASPAGTTAWRPGEVAGPPPSPAPAPVAPPPDPRRFAPATPPPAPPPAAPAAPAAVPPRAEPPRAPRRPLGPKIALVAVLGVSLLLIGALGWTLLSPGGTSTASARASTFDPPSGGGDGVENDVLADNAVDGDPDTAWATESYNDPDITLLKPGVGLVLDLGGPRRVQRLEVLSPTQGWNAEVYVLDDVPDADSPVVDEPPAATATDIDGDGAFDLDGAEGSVVMLWITRTGAEGTVTVDEATVKVDS